MFVVLLGGEGEVRRFARRQEGLVFFVVTEKLRRYRFDRTGIAVPQRVDAPIDDTWQRRSRIGKDQRELRAALTTYKTNTGSLPSEDQGLAALIKRPKVDAPENWIAVLKKLPADPWGNPYGWDGDVIFSLGADGKQSRDDVVEPFSFTDEGELFIPPSGDG